MSKRTLKHTEEMESGSASSPIENQETYEELDRAMIADRAYQRWVERGCPLGTAQEDWLEAEKELRSEGAALRRAG